MALDQHVYKLDEKGRMRLPSEFYRTQNFSPELIIDARSLGNIIDIPTCLIEQDVEKIHQCAEVDVGQVRLRVYGVITPTSTPTTVKDQSELVPTVFDNLGLTRHPLTVDSHRRVTLPRFFPRVTSLVYQQIQNVKIGRKESTVLAIAEIVMAQTASIAAE